MDRVIAPLMKIVAVVAAIVTAGTARAGTYANRQAALLLAHRQQAEATEADHRMRWRIVATALRYVGVPYVWGGTSPSGFDCSGFVQYVFRRVGISLPRTTWSQMSVGRRVSYAGLRAGDAVFTYGGEHVGIYLGHGSFIDANHTGSAVGIRSLAMYPAYAGARRYR